MRIDGAKAVITLEREQSLRIERGVRVEIACGAGVLWITQEGDVRDLFLAHGERLDLVPRGVTLITALERTQVGVTDLRVGRAAARAAKALLQRLGRALRSRVSALRPPLAVPPALVVRR